MKLKSRKVTANSINFNQRQAQQRFETVQEIQEISTCWINQVGTTGNFIRNGWLTSEVQRCGGAKLIPNNCEDGESQKFDDENEFITVMVLLWILLLRAPALRF